jgi:hypothetical protein
MLAAAPTAHALPVTFSYTQSDTATGAGFIAPFLYDDGGGNIAFGATAMPSAVVVNPVPGMTPPGFVGAQTVQSGASNEPNTLVGLTFAGSVTAFGTRGINVYSMQIPLRFVPKVTQVPDTHDYTWSVTYGDSPANGIDAVTTSLRYALYMSRDDVVDAAETPNTFQRYTQSNATFGAGPNVLINTQTSSAAIKDATDAGNPAGVDAAGRDLAFYYGWRDQGALNSGAILIDEFTIGGLLNADEASLQFVIPEPSAVATAVAGLLSMLGLAALRRRSR